MSAADSIKRHEGYRDYPYLDTTGHWSVGWGTNIERMPNEGKAYPTVGKLLDMITDPNMHEKWFEKRFHESERGARTFAGKAWEGLSEPRQEVLVELCYQLGYPRLSGFRRFQRALQEGRWVEAHAEMLDSKWAKQTPARAAALADKFLEGNE